MSSKGRYSWRCEVCQNAVFDTYDEALDHEQSCWTSSSAFPPMSKVAPKRTTSQVLFEFCQSELRDKELFTQPDICHRGECLLCFLPMPLDNQKSTFYSCCSTYVCQGCDYAYYRSNGGDRCPFCREPVVDEEEKEKRMMKRIKANDPAALCEMGTKLFYEGEYEGALEYYTKAAELGEAVAHCQLGYMYWFGRGVERDEEKGVYHYDKAAIGGHPDARYNLGCVEHYNGNMERAVKHFIIAANLGHEGSMKALWGHYSAGDITKEELEVTLRTHQAAVDSMKSPGREEVEAWRETQRDARRRN